MSFYDWHSTFSRQTGSQGEFCFVIGGKGIGKTFGLRLQCVRDYLKKRVRFVELCRTKEEMKSVQAGYFDKLQQEGFFTNCEFKCEKNQGFISTGQDWECICYFVALTDFQKSKKRTFANVRRVIFDEAVIDSRDRYHRYLSNEFYILTNILDTIFREQPNDDPVYRVYLLGNACDMSCPYFEKLGIRELPEFGYHFYNGKHTLLHYVPPMDAKLRKEKTLVGRLLANDSEADMVFENKFDTGSKSDICAKPATARFAFALRYKRRQWGIWLDYSSGIMYVNAQVPKDAHVYSLTKKDGTVDYRAIRKTSGVVKGLVDLHYSGAIRYETAFIRESFFEILSFLGVA